MADTKTDMTLIEPVGEAPRPDARELEALDRLLQVELAAVQSYERCLGHVDSTYHPQLEKLRDSHQLRSEQIHNHIALLGGRPSTTSGVWRPFAQAVEENAGSPDERVALEALEVGELHGVRQYQDLSALEPETRVFVRSHLRPEQQRTYATLGELIREAS